LNVRSAIHGLEPIHCHQKGNRLDRFPDVEVRRDAPRLGRDDQFGATRWGSRRPTGSSVVVKATHAPSGEMANSRIKHRALQHGN
jgi:hypothetical protein